MSKYSDDDISDSRLYNYRNVHPFKLPNPSILGSVQSYGKAVQEHRIKRQERENKEYTRKYLEAEEEHNREQELIREELRRRREEEARRR